MDDNVSYHGTNKENASLIVGPPSELNINVGKGELGKGFYTGSSLALAAIWAQTRYKEKGVVIEFDIPKENFVKLKGHIVKTQEEVNEHWKKFTTENTLATHTFEYDYVVAPFATIEHTGSQYKFESQKAEDTLKLATKKIYSCE